MEGVYLGFINFADVEAPRKMGDEKDAFYVVRKGDVVGVYKSISDLQSILRTSVITSVILE